ncbi:DeoR/GlpR family DNA-binding transcription regulator [Oscillospiraceae bacterium PP1C4]
MIASERRLYIMRSLNEKGIVNLKEIAKELEVAEITTRRDFEKLEEMGKLKRVQGGAALENLLDSAELTMHKKESINTSVKVKVAQYAAELVSDGECVFIDGGTSNALLIDYLSRKQITIVTYNELVVRKLEKPTAAEILIIGGRFVPGFCMNVGSMAQESLRQFHFDVGFFGCSSINVDENIAYITSTDSLIMKKIALENADKRILLIDATKLQKMSFLKFANTDAFDRVICDTPTFDFNAPANYELI